MRRERAGVQLYTLVHSTGSRAELGLCPRSPYSGHMSSCLIFILESVEGSTLYDLLSVLL
jgi:hypothetical protein